MLLTQEIWLTETMCFLLSLLKALACGTTSMLHTCLSIDRWMAVAFPIAYRNINLNVPHKLTVIGIIVIALLPGFSIYLSWIFKQGGVYFDAYIHVPFRETGIKLKKCILLITVLKIVPQIKLQPLKILHVCLP